jgi:prolipoprotein diacylglyceryltransferase
VILMYGILYPLLRFFTEFQRPDAWKIAGVATAQWISVATILVCGGLLLWRHRTSQAVPPTGAGSAM